MGSGVDEITAVVVRYYGGILLGTGGVVKAYGGGVQQALNMLWSPPAKRHSPNILCCATTPSYRVSKRCLNMVNGVIYFGDYRAMVSNCAWRFPSRLNRLLFGKLADFSRGSTIAIAD